MIGESCRTYVFALLPIFIAFQGAAQENKDSQSDEQVYDLGPGITPPRVIRQVPPHNSMVHGVRVSGKVTIGLVVTSEGLPKDGHVVHGIEEEVDRAALAALKQWRFAPAKKNGKPIAVRVVIEIEFHSM